MAKNTSISLGAHFDQFFDQLIESGRYASVSEVIRAGLRKLEEEHLATALGSFDEAILCLP
ncbi:type II toxin-antitoxin system ParD family antitoxin [Pseudidiomarina marina]|uniref:type II toxin-antitoxin system ParD family antitoxin n=1 Tax=Pseudidiomarina marina TaxID=502366 RepID=UPI00384F0B43